eukprot:scaffold2209_cov57-Attheya_sp.AAC.1
MPLRGNAKSNLARLGVKDGLSWGSLESLRISSHSALLKLFKTLSLPALFNTTCRIQHVVDPTDSTLYAGTGRLRYR